jgi:hypothetical protein
MGTAVTLVMIWQTVFTVMDTISSISKWLSAVGQRKKRTTPYVAPVRLPTSAILHIENPFKKAFGKFLLHLLIARYAHCGWVPLQNPNDSDSGQNWKPGTRGDFPTLRMIHFFLLLLEKNLFMFYSNVKWNHVYITA